MQLADTKIICQIMTWQAKLITRIERELKKRKRVRFLVTIENGNLDIEEIGKVERIIK